MAGEKINYDYITEYLHQVLPETKGYLKDMEEYAHINEVPREEEFVRGHRCRIM